MLANFLTNVSGCAWTHDSVSIRNVGAFAALPLGSIQFWISIDFVCDCALTFRVTQLNKRMVTSRVFISICFCVCDSGCANVIGMQCVSGRRAVLSAMFTKYLKIWLNHLLGISSKFQEGLAVGFVVVDFLGVCTWGFFVMASFQQMDANQDRDDANPWVWAVIFTCSTCVHCRMGWSLARSSCSEWWTAFWTSKVAMKLLVTRHMHIYIYTHVKSSVFLAGQQSRWPNFSGRAFAPDKN